MEERREKKDKGRKKSWKSGGGREAKRDREASQTQRFPRPLSLQAERERGSEKLIPQKSKS
jgi:hypothetical protein